jgi:uncharacterized damage-inducible protein DinB
MARTRNEHVVVAVADRRIRCSPALTVAGRVACPDVLASFGRRGCGRVSRMSEDHKQRLHDYLTKSREAVIWKEEGLSEYDARRPLTRTGTNLLGLIKHLSVGEVWYFGRVFDRPFEPHLPWWDDDAAEGDDMWVATSERRQNIVETYRAVIAHADETISSLDLDAPGHVPWWPQPDVTLQAVLVHVLAETARHAGHADILREQLDGRTGMRPDNLNQEPHDDQWWADYRSRIEAAARSAASM